eukprot:TRINITY_DN9978_c0_g1_i1.p2 TRINITY_DN9978_c0_g1~~TRINITY_DN9978_c0_g1_i1.p2  ORF type:complete len:171 (+),score=43.38 TRINITY_DN9978_c0_g1_i1:55-567(+)
MCIRDRYQRRVRECIDMQFSRVPRFTSPNYFSQPAPFRPSSQRWFSSRRYTKEHEWIRVEGDIGVVGITDFAQKELGDVVYAELPDKGSSRKQKEVIVSIESVKAASDVYSPASGSIVEVNDKLKNDPALINKSPYEDGWMVKLKLSSPKEVESLMDDAAYKKHVEDSKH